MATRRELDDVSGLPLREADRALAREALALLVAKGGFVVGVRGQLSDCVRRSPPLVPPTGLPRLTQEPAVPIGQAEAESADQATVRSMALEDVVERGTHILALGVLQELHPEEQRTNAKHVERPVHHQMDHIHAPRAQGPSVRLGDLCRCWRPEAGDTDNDEDDEVSEDHPGIMPQLVVVVAARATRLHRRHRPDYADDVLHPEEHRYQDTYDASFEGQWVAHSQPPAPEPKQSPHRAAAASAPSPTPLVWAGLHLDIHGGRRRALRLHRRTQLGLINLRCHNKPQVALGRLLLCDCHRLCVHCLRRLRLGSLRFRRLQSAEWLGRRHGVAHRRHGHRRVRTSCRPGALAAGWLARACLRAKISSKPGLVKAWAEADGLG
mmetsp:Transcript_85510/g.191136  ORF Transcript_85510/g.191136 Transcript_85510/m.191136 type:complete len:380 (+) Transcript_85510:360-1499(+)